MREIKFRAKAIPQDEWIYGHFCFVSKAFGLPHDTPSIQQFNVDETQTLSYRQIDPDTVGQFTGLHDKNGKEIYEGDIVRYDMGGECEVSYCIGGGFAGFDLSPAYHDEHKLTDVEVIGNIHDNLDLLIAE